jgi:hypothetical protein
MSLNAERYKKDLNGLCERADFLELAMVLDVYGRDILKRSLKISSEKDLDEIVKKLPEFRSAYEKWYSESVALLKQLMPDRLADFVGQYKRPANRKSIGYENYSIEDYMVDLKVTRGLGDVVVDKSAGFRRFQNQKHILNAANARFESSLFEIRQLVQADLFDSEIEAAKELLKNKFLRAAGAIAGVVVEKHLQQVCDDHGVKVPKKNPLIGDLNELLKTNSVIDIPQWRHISFLSDIRNLCDHNKKVEPTEQQVADLIDGASKVLKTIS